MKRLMVVLLCLLCAFPALAEESFVFGLSEQGRELVCHRVGDGEQAVLMVFAVHGFEDMYDRDGQMLVDIAHALLNLYREDPSGLNGHSLYVVPCLNPDGLIAGKSNEGFGRKNAGGIDINRDFPAEWTKKESNRNQTGDAPFATAEARALRDLVFSIQPVCAVDVHGWINGVYGTEEMAACFAQAFGFETREYSSGGMLSQWLQQQTGAAVLVELPGNPYLDQFAENCARKLSQGLNAWLAQ